MKSSYLNPFKISTLFMAFSCAPLSNYACAGLSAKQQESKTQGITLYNQYKPAESELRIAAEAGDTEAQFYLAEELREQKRYITKESQKWYEAAATQGDLYAMLRLATSNSDLCSLLNSCTDGSKKPAEWLELLNKEAGLQAKDGDGEAMYILYLATGKLEWLEKSAVAGFARGQWLLANRYKEGERFFFPWKRNEEVGRWLKASAENGFPEGMLEYGGFLYETSGDVRVAQHWIEEAAKTGHVSGVSSYGAYVAHAPALYDFPLDLVKGYALTSLLTELDGGGNIKPYVDEALPEIGKKMSPAQISEAKALAKQWKETHPPLSFFPGKFGF